MTRKLPLITLGALCIAEPALAGDDSIMLGRSLSLSDCVKRAIRENPDLRSEQLNILIGEEQIRAELAAFAWNVEAASILQHRDKPQNAREASANSSLSRDSFEEDSWRSSMAFTKLLTPGTRVEVGTRHSVTANDLTRDSFFATFNPEHEFFMGVTLTQPLLRGFGRTSTLAEVDLARLRTESARMLTMIKAMNLVAEVAARYTDVVAAQKNLVVKMQNIERAQSIVERNKKRLESGRGVENEVTTAELAVFQRRDDYLDTQLEKVERLNALAALLHLGPNAVAGSEFVPVSGFGLEGALPAREALISEAIKQRIDLDYYSIVMDSARLNVRRAENGALPSLNVVGSAGAYGLDGSTSDAMERAIENQGREFSLGLEFRMDLGGEAGKSAIEIARHQFTQAELGYGKARNTISLEVDTAYSRVLNVRQRLTTAYKARDLAKKNLEAEELLLEQSKGDLYRVIERQQLYGDANARVVTTTALLSKAMIGLWLASGQLFDRYGITEHWISTEVERTGAK